MQTFNPTNKVRDRFSVSALLTRLLELPVLSRWALQVVKVSPIYRRMILLFSDIILSLLSISVVLGVRLNYDSIQSLNLTYAGAILLVVLLRLFSFHVFGLYRQLLRYVNSSILGLVLKAVIFSEISSQVIFTALELKHLPRSVRLGSGLLYILLIFISRLGITQVLRASDSHAVTSVQQHFSPVNSDLKPPQVTPVVIYGAGAGGFVLHSLLMSEQNYKVVAFFDDNPRLQGRMVTGTPVYPPTCIGKVIREFNVEDAFIAIPSASASQKRKIVRSLKSLSLRIKTVPGVAEIVSGQFSLGQVRTLDITDLLGREEVLPSPDLLAEDIQEKVVLVTGAGGSIGSELCRQIARQKPSKLVLFELNEYALYSIDIELAESFPKLTRVACLGSVNDSTRLEQIMRHHEVETVYHAAAYKHVPLVEANASQGVINNTLGTLSAAQSAIAANVNTFVLISTDKAVRPTNVMGASKRAAELVLQALSARSDVQTRFVMVRFGNVLDSSGSVVPRFRKQIAERQPITVTHREITRYFMSIPEAARLVIQAGAMANGGEVFLLDMGEPIKIYDLAVQMIELSGLRVNEDVDIEITGLRPGEKLYEELLIDGSTAMKSEHPKIYCANEAMLPWPQLEVQLQKLFAAANGQLHHRVVEILKEIVPEYAPRIQKKLTKVESISREAQLVHN